MTPSPAVPPGTGPGHAGPAVVALQGHLARFGYLPPCPVLPSELTAGPVAPEPAAGHFDDATRAALCRLQAFLGVPVTGTVDPATSLVLARPRCGVPDTGEYSISRRRWSETDLGYALDAGSQDLPQDDVLAALAAAFDLWAAVSPLRFALGPADQPAQLRIGFYVGEHGDGQAFDGPGAVLAHAFFPPVPPQTPAPIQGDIHFDEGEAWTVALPPPDGSVDLVTVAAHEVGHAIGLAHSTVPTALMAPTYAGPQRRLDPDDVAGVQALYGRPR